MNVLVIGCGRLGSQLANMLHRYGHDVAVVDKDEDNFRLLSEDFDGLTVSGMPMDMDVLRSAGVESCDAVAVVTPDDNLNITISQIVKHFFGMENVVARISDPAREEVFHQFGLRTVCPTNLGGSAMFTALTQPWEEKQVSFNTCTVSFHLHLADSSIIGRPLSDIPTEPGESITGVLHADDSASLYDGRQNIIIQKGDRIILSYVCD